MCTNNIAAKHKVEMKKRKQKIRAYFSVKIKTEKQKQLDAQK